MMIDVPSSPSPLVSIIIPTRTLELVREVLTSLQDHAPRHIPMQTIVVLNGPATDIATELRATVTGIEIVESDVNRGLAGAANLGRARAVGELLVLLHDDAMVEPGWLEALVSSADDTPEAGAIGSKVLFPDGRLQTAGMILWSDAVPSRPWTGVAPSPSSFDEPRIVDFCGTSSLMVRAAVWDAIGGLDERFYPAYYVDVDLSMGVRQQGHVVLYQPASIIRHRSGVARNPRWSRFVSNRNRRIFIDKWHRELLEQPANDGDVDSAVARAAARGPAAPSTPDGSADRPTPTAFDDAAYIVKAVQLRDEYEQHLVSSLDEADMHMVAMAAQVDACERELAARRAGSAYLMGTRLEFRAQGTAHRFQSSGGHPPEDWGVWLGEVPLRILLPLVDEAAPGQGARHDLCLEVESVPLLSSLRVRSPIVVSLNGHEVLRADQSEPGVQHHRVTVQADLLAGDANLVVTVTGEDAVAPSAVGMGNDQRLLSVGLIALTIDAAR